MFTSGEVTNRWLQGDPQYPEDLETAPITPEATTDYRWPITAAATMLIMTATAIVITSDGIDTPRPQCHMLASTRTGIDSYSYGVAWSSPFNRPVRRLVIRFEQGSLFLLNTSTIEFDKPAAAGNELNLDLQVGETNIPKPTYIGATLTDASGQTINCGQVVVPK